MPSMVLCPSCKRHVFPRETACPFCAVAISAEPGAPPLALAPELSRAQRYVVGAAIAATVAVAGCNSKPANDPNAELEKERQKMQQENLEQQHQGGGPCGPNGNCPPYGCVFPDEACDIVRI